MKQFLLKQQNHPVQRLQRIFYCIFFFVCFGSLKGFSGFFNPEQFAFRLKILERKFVDHILEHQEQNKNLHNSNIFAIKITDKNKNSFNKL